LRQGQEWLGFGELSSPHVGFAEIVVGVVALRVEFGGLLELRFGEVSLPRRVRLAARFVRAAAELGFRRAAFSRWGLALASSDWAE